MLAMDDTIRPMRLQEATIKEISDTQSINYVRYLSCLAFAGTKNLACEHFLQRWPHGATAAIKKELDILQGKSAVSPGTSGGWGSPLIGVSALADGFVKIARSASVIGKIPGVRTVPFGTKCPTEVTPAVYHWVGETKVKPISAMAFADNIFLQVYKATGVIVLSREFVKLAVPGTERSLRDTLVAGLVSFQDVSFLSPTSTEIVGVRPASITAGLTPIAPTGNLQTDVASLLTAFFTARPGATENTVLIAGASKAAQIKSWNSGGGVGLPVIVSEAAGQTVIVVDGSGIFVADEGVEIKISDTTSVQMSDTPDDPVLSTSVSVSLFQINAVAYRTERVLNFKAAPTSVAYLAAA